MWIIKKGIAAFALFRRRFPPSDVEMEDRISELPEEVLCLIISRLSAQDAAKTSILSRRWRHLYKFITHVSFPCCEMFGLRFVRDQPRKYMMLQQKFWIGLQTCLYHHRAFKITSFDLSCCYLKFFRFDLDHLFRSLGRMGVENLKLSYGCDPVDSFNEIPTFSCDLLSSVPSLKYLHLSRFILHPNFASQCTSLNILALYHVTLGPGAVERILSYCLNLQSLTVCRCSLPPNLSIDGSNLVLESLVIYWCYDLQELHLNAINLITFEYCPGTMSNIVFFHVPLLQNLSVSVNGYDAIPYVFGELTKDLPHLKSLSFETSGEFYQGLKPFAMNTLSNLRELVLSSSTELESDLLNISMIFNVCPVLEKFRLWTSGVTFHGPKAEMSMTHHTCLKEVELSMFSGTINEVNFALYIVETAAVLERMYINIHEVGWDEETRKMICKQLQEVAVSKSLDVIMQALPLSYVSTSIFTVENNTNHIASTSSSISQSNNNIFGTIKALFTAWKTMAKSALNGVAVRLNPGLAKITGLLTALKTKAYSAVSGVAVKLMEIMDFCVRHNDTIELIVGLTVVMNIVLLIYTVKRVDASFREMLSAFRETKAIFHEMLSAFPKLDIDKLPIEIVLFKGREKKTTDGNSMMIPLMEYVIQSLL